jgi:hypothetical protein
LFTYKNKRILFTMASINNISHRGMISYNHIALLLLMPLYFMYNKTPSRKE